MTLQGQARLRRVGNSLCVPLPARDLREEGLGEGDTVNYIVMKPQRRDPRAFGSLKKYFRGTSIEELLGRNR